MSRFGLDGIDALVPEGIPKAGAVLVLVPAVEEKDQIAAQFVLEGLRNADAAIVLESEAGLRDLSRRLGNMGLDSEHAVSEGRLVLLDWSAAVAAREGVAAGSAAVKAALTAAISPAKVFSGLRAVVDVSGTLPDAIDPEGLDTLAVDLADALRSAGALSLFLNARARALAPVATEAFELVLDLRLLKPSGLGLAVVTIRGTPLPKSHMVLESQEGRLVLRDPRRGAAPLSASVECPVCKSTIPAGAPECPVCKSPRPVRRPGEPEVLDYIEALGQRVGMQETPLEPAPAPEPEGREGGPATPEPPRRGLTNGLARRRRMAPPATAAPSGRVNGLTSTILATRRGMTNGLTNGNGFTNGLGGRRSVAESRAGAWRVYLVPIVAVALLAFPLLIAPGAPPASTYGIDGSFGDWPDRVALSPDLSLPAAVDLTFAAVRGYTDRLFGFVETRAPLLAGSPDGTRTDSFHAFIDLDGAASTGYRVAGIGADVLAAVSGAGGDVTSAVLSEFTGADPDDWSGWESSDRLLAAAGTGSEANRLELSFVIPSGRDGAPAQVLFQSLSWDGAEDLADVAVSPSAIAVLVTQASIAPDRFTGDTATLLEVRVRSPQGPSMLQGIRVEKVGTLPNTALRGATLRDAAAGVLATDTNYQNGYSLDLGTPIAIEAEQVLRVGLQVDPAATGTVGLVIGSSTDVRAQGSAITLVTAAADRDLAYVGAVPGGASIDGAFGEWPAPSTDGVGETSARGNADVDLTAFDSLRAGADLAFYARVAGRPLQGALVPARSPAIAPGGAPDADRDTVPDAEDPMPRDFNNNGTDDAQEAGDLDGDGVSDHPAGPDRYLNTTIPSTFPPPYSGRFVSLYIGPVERPPARGHDTLRVFVDTDANTTTGYAVAGLGADVLVEVSGRDGRVAARSFSGFAGGPNRGAWAWTRLGDATVTLGSRQLEAAITLPTAPVAAVSHFDLSDWRGSFDVSDTSVTRSFTRGTRGGGLGIETNSYATEFADGPTDSIAFTTPGGAGVRWAPSAIAGRFADGSSWETPLGYAIPGLSGSEVRYEISAGGAGGTLVYAAGPTTLKELLTLDSPSFAAALGAGEVEFRFDLTLSPGTSIAAGSGDAGGIAAFDGSGRWAFALTEPFLVDSNGDTADCRYALRVGAPSRLDVVCPSVWLADAAYPVTLDPTVVTVENDGAEGQAGEQMGFSVAVADFNQDGYADLLSGAPYNSKNGTNSGFAYIYYGPFTSAQTDPDVRIEGGGANRVHGYAVAAGNLNGDAYPDAVVSQWGTNLPTRIYFGKASWGSYENTPDINLSAAGIDTDWGQFGYSLAVGNVDNAFYGDVVVGRPTASTLRGRAHLFLSPFTADRTDSNFTLQPADNQARRFGNSLAIGQIDDDSYLDIIVGEPGYTNNDGTGRISFFAGDSFLSGSGLKSPNSTVAGSGAGTQFGWAVAVGKLNGDAYADVLVGANKATTSNGAAYVFLAQSDGSGISNGQGSAATLTPAYSGGEFGTSVLIGDAMGDGTGDAIVGAPKNNTSTGTVYVYDNPLSDQTVDAILEGAQTDEQFGQALAAGKFANDNLLVIAIGANRWDDASPSEANAGRVGVTSIPEFESFAPAVATILIGFVLLRRRRSRAA